MRVEDVLLIALKIRGLIAVLLLIIGLTEAFLTDNLGQNMFYPMRFSTDYIHGGMFISLGLLILVVLPLAFLLILGINYIVEKNYYHGILLLLLLAFIVLFFVVNR